MALPHCDSKALKRYERNRETARLSDEEEVVQANGGHIKRYRYLNLLPSAATVLLDQQRLSGQECMMPRYLSYCDLNAKTLQGLTCATKALVAIRLMGSRV
ncbi:hypothetical protein L873DRAFT_923018 [Choiromyces venosus 120613-1]|uniref:Uncharacterized protein n=1 Tax=Choiromyces venosus 120613-1 TaxID=1336337 RepID=A0A3N4JMB3_9PEZI|nr:hypothetical protein L873DRAFT_923018 [Choiromyces venosus 120613-1]